MASVEEAFQKIQRTDFLPGELRTSAGIDAPLPIGQGQTNSQPSTVRMMLEWLDAKEGQKVLDVGSGSGWTTAVLAYIVGPKGQVYAVERIPELLRQSIANVQRLGFQNAQFHQAGEEYGWPENAPYDRILVSASARELPRNLIYQLNIGGKLVIPVQSDILEITKTAPHDYETKTHPGFKFVPLI